MQAKLIELNHKIRIGAVSYLNTKPLLYGIKNSELIHSIDLVEDYPSKIAELLINNTIDIGLIPVAAIQKIADATIVGDYCIGSNDEVLSVGIFSDVPLNEIDTILLDYQSNTSVLLTKILCKEFWLINPKFIETKTEFSEKINGVNAGLVIGDRAFKQKEKSKYYFDLGLAWKQFAGLPFVYAAWVANKKIPDSFIVEFNKANAMYKVSMKLISNSEFIYSANVKDYLTNKISYELNDEKRKALNLFLGKIKNYI